MSQTQKRIKRKRDPCDYRYIAESKSGFKHPKALELIDYIPNRLSTNSSINHADFRKKKSKYLTKEDARDEDVSIKVPRKVNIENPHNVIFEIGTIEISGSRESIKRVCVRMTETPVEVTNTNTSYDQYDYCLVLDINNPEQPYSSSISLITVYLNEKNDWHNTLNNSNYNNKNNIQVTLI